MIGDAVTAASGLKGANKQFTSQFTIGHETRRLAGDRIHAHELNPPDGVWARQRHVDR
jgi:hypothetical protein